MGGRGAGSATSGRIVTSSGTSYTYEEAKNALTNYANKGPNRISDTERNELIASNSYRNQLADDIANQYGIDDRGRNYIHNASGALANALATYTYNDASSEEIRTAIATSDAFGIQARNYIVDNYSTGTATKVMNSLRNGVGSMRKAFYSTKSNRY